MARFDINSPYSITRSKFDIASALASALALKKIVYKRKENNFQCSKIFDFCNIHFLFSDRTNESKLKQKRLFNHNCLYIFLNLRHFIYKRLRTGQPHDAALKARLLSIQLMLYNISAF